MPICQAGAPTLEKLTGDQLGPTQGRDSIVGSNIGVSSASVVKFSVIPIRATKRTSSRGKRHSVRSAPSAADQTAGRISTGLLRDAELNHTFFPRIGARTAPDLTCRQLCDGHSTRPKHVAIRDDRKMVSARARLHWPGYIFPSSQSTAEKTGSSVQVWCPTSQIADVTTRKSHVALRTFAATTTRIAQDIRPCLARSASPPRTAEPEFTNLSCLITPRNLPWEDTRGSSGKPGRCCGRFAARRETP